MIDSKNRFIFIHIPKCAGQSIQHFLIKSFNLYNVDRRLLFVGENDGRVDGPEMLTHFSLMELLNSGAINSDELEEYFKFTFVRHPIDRAVSIYKFLSKPNQTFDDFVKKELLGSLLKSKYYFVRPQCEFICDSTGKIAVDFVGRFEDIESDVRKLAKHLSLDEGCLALFKHRNSSTRINFKLPKSWQGFKDWINSGRKKIKSKVFKNNGVVINHELDSLLREFYALDFEVLGYR